MTAYVFDAEPLIAYLYDEPGSDEVEELLDEIDRNRANGMLSEVTACEVAYKVARIESDGSPGETELTAGKRDVRLLERAGLAIEPASWPVAARVKADGGISLGDAYAVALAVDRDATLVVGGDSEFEDLPVEVDRRRFRLGVG